MPLKKIGKIKPVAVALTAILSLSVFFRFYHLTDWFSFGMDTEYEAFLVKNIVTFKHFPLIGVNAGGTGIYLGPVFIYLAALPFVLFGGNPLGWAITASFLGVFTTWLVYYVSNKLFGLASALFASFIYASSFLIAFYDRAFWNPTPVPLLSLLIIYFLYRIYLNKQNCLLYLAFVFGLAFHTHLSLLIFTPLIFYVIIRKFKIFKKRILVFSLTVFLLLQLPLLIFEFRHNFTNSKAVVNLIMKNGNAGSDRTVIAQRAGTLYNFFGRFLFVPPYPDLFTEKGLCQDLIGIRKNAYPEITVLTLLGIAFFFYINTFLTNKNKSNFPQRLLISVFLLSVFSALVYKRTFQEYYFLLLSPVIAIMLGRVLAYLWKKNYGKPVVLSLLAFFLILNLITLFTAKNSYSHSLKLEITDFARSFVNGRDYDLEALGDCPRFAGWGYLFEYYLTKPNHSYLDSYYRWLNFDPGSELNPQSIVLLSMIDPRSKNVNISKWQEDKIRFLTEFKVVAEKLRDNIQVFILEVKK